MRLFLLIKYILHGEDVYRWTRSSSMASLCKTGRRQARFFFPLSSVLSVTLVKVRQQALRIDL